MTDHSLIVLGVFVSAKCNDMCPLTSVQMHASEILFIQRVLSCVLSVLLDFQKIGT